ncbi:hypothetical protein TGCAST_202080 [Toxoplasma gondii CAST]|uniref:RAP domain-containing protein n=1 Tax=Toxoplasma gondii CAST TaxID=943122 RepID=A0A425I3K0_TOXGO|nr:hypothetical protein TGCAST_202080 [Toxoplasma gondii CAST]
MSVPWRLRGGRVPVERRHGAATCSLRGVSAASHSSAVSPVSLSASAQSSSSFSFPSSYSSICASFSPGCPLRTESSAPSPAYSLFSSFYSSSPSLFPLWLSVSPSPVPLGLVGSCPTRAEVASKAPSLRLSSSTVSRSERLAQTLLTLLPPRSALRREGHPSSRSWPREFMSSSPLSSSSRLPLGARTLHSSSQLPFFSLSPRGLSCLRSRTPLPFDPQQSNRVSVSWSCSSDFRFFPPAPQATSSRRVDTSSRADTSRCSYNRPRCAYTVARCIYTASVAARETGEKTRDAPAGLGHSPSVADLKRVTAPCLPPSQVSSFSGDSRWIDSRSEGADNRVQSLAGQAAACAPQTRQRRPRLPACSSESHGERRQELDLAKWIAKTKDGPRESRAHLNAQVEPEMLAKKQTASVFWGRPDGRFPPFSPTESPLPRPACDSSCISFSPDPSSPFPSSPVSSSSSSCSPFSSSPVSASSYSSPVFSSSSSSSACVSPSPLSRFAAGRMQSELGALESALPPAGSWARGARASEGVRVPAPAFSFSGETPTMFSEFDRRSVSPPTLPCSFHRSAAAIQSENRRSREERQPQDDLAPRAPPLGDRQVNRDRGDRGGVGDRGRQGDREGERGRVPERGRKRDDPERTQRVERRQGVSSRAKEARTVVGKLMEDAVDLVEAFEAFRDDTKTDLGERRGKLHAYQTDIFKIHLQIAQHVHEATEDELLELRGHVEALLMRQKLVVDRRLLLPLLEELYKREMVDSIRMSTLVRYFRDLCDTNQGDSPAADGLIKRVHASIMGRQQEFLDNRDLGNALLLFLYNSCLLRLPTGALYPEWARRSVAAEAERGGSHAPLKISPPLVVFVSRILIAERCGAPGVWHAVLNLTLSIDPRTSPFFFAASPLITESESSPAERKSAFLSGGEQTLLQATDAAQGDFRGGQEEANDAVCRYTPGDEAQWLANATRTAAGAAAMGIPFHPALEIIFDRVAETVKDERTAAFQTLFACQAERHSCRLLQYIWSLCFYNFHLHAHFPAILHAACKHGRLEHAAQYLLNFSSPAFVPFQMAEAVMFAVRETGERVQRDLSVLCKEHLDDILTCVRPSCAAWASNFLSPHPSFRADFERHLTLNSVRFAFINRRGVSCLHLLDLKGDVWGATKQQSQSSLASDETPESLSSPASSSPSSCSSPSSSSSSSPSSSASSVSRSAGAPVCVVLIDLARQPRDVTRELLPGLLGGHRLHNRLLRRLGWDVRVVCQSDWDALNTSGKAALIQKILERHAPANRVSGAGPSPLEADSG